MLQSNSQEVEESEKEYFNTSIGQIEVVNEQRNKTEATKYCKENDGILIPLHNQEIVDEVSDKLKDIKFIEEINFFHVGLDCKNGIYQWQDGKEFN